MGDEVRGLVEGAIEVGELEIGFKVASGLLGPTEGTVEGCELLGTREGDVEGVELLGL